ncbi:MAG: hypothetical protein AB8F74_02650 [Saprospiraceae bacterium]
MLLLDIFCAECTPYLLLMLAGAWGLGWLFWKLLKENGYLDNIKNLEGEVETINKENVDLKTEITQVNYEVEKAGQENMKLRTKIGDLDIQQKADKEKFNLLQQSHEKLQSAYNELKT